MDKATPKDVFQANRDRAAPLLAKLKSDGIGHMIDGKTVPSISGQTFETKSPVDGAVLAIGRPRQCRRYRPRRDRCSAGLQILARHAGGDAEETAASRRRRDRGARRRDRAARMHGHRPGASLHGQGRVARGREFPLLRRQMRRGPRRPNTAERGALEHHDPRADRPGRRDHAVEHAVHAVDLEDRAGAGGRLHGRAQAGGMVAGHRATCWRSWSSRPGCPTAC